MEIVKKSPIMRTAVVVLILLCIVSAAYVFNPRPKEKPFTGSEKIDIGGYSLFIKCTGEGNPTIVFDSGWGMQYASWYGVTNIIDKTTHTVLYSRAGMGSSDKSPLDRTCETKTEELHKLLEASHIKGPYILVGHSLGGFVVRLFAAKYPDEVAGIVLVDASHEEFGNRIIGNMTEEEKKAEQEYEARINKSAAPDGNYIDIEKSVEQVRKVRNAIKDIPLTVIVAQQSIESKQYGNKGEIWMELQKELASLSTKSKLIIAKNSSHNVPGDEPEVIADALLEMLDTVRK